MTDIDKTSAAGWFWLPIPWIWRRCFDWQAATTCWMFAIKRALGFRARCGVWERNR